MSRNVQDDHNTNFQILLNVSSDAILILDPNGLILNANLAAIQSYGYNLATLKHMNISDLTPYPLKNQFLPQLHQSLEKAKPFEWTLQRQNGAHKKIVISSRSITVHGKNAILASISNSNISQSDQADFLLRMQRQLLEMILSKTSLSEILTVLARLIETHAPKILVSILLLDEDGIHIRHGAAPSLPEAFITAVDGQVIGPSAGSCGTAAYLKKAIFVEDIACDPIWENYKEVALANGLHACWSTPIFNERQQVLGTFAIYYRQPGLPPSNHQELINVATYIVAIAITYQRTEEALRKSESHIHNIFDQASDGIYIISANNQYLNANTYGLELLGYSRTELLQKNVVDMLAPHEMTRLTMESQRIMSGEPYLKEWEHVRKNGSTFTGEISARRLDEHSYLAIVRDLTVRKKTEQALRKSEAEFRELFESSRDAIMIVHIEKGFLNGNIAACTLFGCHDKSEFITLSPASTSPEFQADGRRSDEKAQEMMKIALDRGSHFFEWTHKQMDGTEFLADVLLTRIDSHDQSLLQANVRDITERKASEFKITRISQLYAALSQCNKTIMRSNSEAELLPLICRDIVNFGGIRMAWIGLLDESKRWIKPIAYFGTGIEYLEGIEISTEANEPTGNGPAGLSVRTNQPFWCQDFQHDPTTSAWHARAAKFGWSASAAIPLHRKGITIGVFSVYADTVNVFDADAQNLLIEMGMNIDYALSYFDQEAAHKQAEKSLRENEWRLRTIFETEPECVKVIGRDGTLLDINTAGMALLEVTSVAEARRHRVLDFILPEYHNSFKTLHKSVMSGKNHTLEFEMIGAKGTKRWLESHSAPLRDENGEISSILSISRDITERKQTDERIQYLANFDGLTGLYNRTKMEEHLKYAISLTKRSNGHLALMFIDIDRFKDINDTLGHSIGDTILIEVAKRLQRLLREEDIVSRLGGDEFLVILPGNNAQGAAQVAQKILAIIAEPYPVEQYELNVTASIGIALYPDDGLNLEMLSKSADTAMYQVKHEGRDGYRFFTTEMQTRASRNLKLVNALRHALDRNQLEVHYQPFISLQSGQIIGAEALLRWQHPELGLVSPTEFIPIAEDCGMIFPIGEWVLRTAIQQLKCWIASGHTSMIIAVNLSAVQFRHASLPDLVMRILNEAQLSPDCLELELTEGVTMHDPLEAIELMRKLHKRGIRLSIDDFGTGYSSLNYLKKFNIYKLKIDQSFVRDISTHVEDRAIITAIINMAKGLGLKTIAEGVETLEQLKFLREQGCDEAQGYHFSEPLNAKQFEHLSAHFPC